MTISTRVRITRELARLKMWRDVANDDEVALETEASHDRINALLDLLDDEKTQSQKVLCHKQSVT